MWTTRNCPTAARWILLAGVGLLAACGSRPRIPAGNPFLAGPEEFGKPDPAHRYMDLARWEAFFASQQQQGVIGSWQRCGNSFVVTEYAGHARAEWVVDDFGVRALLVPDTEGPDAPWRAGLKAALEQGQVEGIVWRSHVAEGQVDACGLPRVSRYYLLSRHVFVSGDQVWTGVAFPDRPGTEYLAQGAHKLELPAAVRFEHVVQEIADHDGAYHQADLDQVAAHRIFQSPFLPQAL